MTVADNIGFALKLAKVPKDEISERVARAAQTLDLTEQLGKKPGQLSGGQRQRVAMGRAIVRQPKAFLMDEPLSNLDAKLRVQMRAEIAGLQRDLGVTTIYVTHDQVEAMTMGDRVAVLKRGILQQVDSPQNLYDYPANVFVAGFIGSPSMNLMKARLEEVDNGLAVRLGDQLLVLSPSVVAEKQALAGYAGKPIVVGLRPEDIEDAALAPDSPPDRRIHTTVSLVEALGAEIIVHFPLSAEPFEIMDQEFEGEDAVATATDETGNYIYVARISPRSRARIGEAIELAVDAARFHFFDPESGLAIA
jgi:multiple sugar transport system ATP-binding protein